MGSDVSFPVMSLLSSFTSIPDLKQTFYMFHLTVSLASDQIPLGYSSGLLNVSSSCYYVRTILCAGM